MRSRLPAEIWVLVSAAFVIAVGYGLIAPVLPSFARSFDVGVSGASVVISAFALFRLLFAPASGALVTRLGERVVYLTGLGIVAVTTLATAFASSYVMLLACRAIGGIGSTMFTVSAMGLLVRMSPPQLRGRVSGLYASAFLVGGVIGPVLGGLLASFGMRVPFIVYAVSLLIAMGVVWAGLPAVVVGADAAVVPGPPVKFGEAVRHPAYRAALASSFVNGWTTFGVRIAHVPLMASLVLAADLWVGGAAMAVFALGNMIAVTRSGGLADLRGRRPLVIAGLAVGGVATTAFGWAQSVWPLLALSLVAGIGVGLMGPAQQAAVADVIGVGRSGGAALAGFQMFGDLGGILGPLIAGVIIDRYGFEGGFGASGALMIAAIVFWVGAPETRPGVASTGPAGRLGE